jgi:transcriptional regulator with XRE-family HTH domain
MDAKLFSERLRRARERKRLTQEDVGRALHMTAEAYGHWERARGSFPKANQLAVIADLLDVSVDWLCGRTPDLALNDSIELPQSAAVGETEANPFLRGASTMADASDPPDWWRDLLRIETTNAEAARLQAQAAYEQAVAARQREELLARAFAAWAPSHDRRRGEGAAASDA